MITILNNKYLFDSSIFGLLSLFKKYLCKCVYARFLKLDFNLKYRILNKHFLSRIGMNFFFFLLFSINYNLSASNIKIAIIDHTKVRIQPKEAIEIRKKIDELVVKFQKDILAQEADLRTEYDLLINDKNMKDTKDYDKKRQAFKAKLSKVQLLSRNNKRKVEIAYKVAIEKFSKKFTTVLTQFQKDEEIDIILKKENILFYKEELDKTAELLKRIDAVYSEVVIEINDKEADDK